MKWWPEILLSLMLMFILATAGNWAIHVIVGNNLAKQFWR